MICIIWFAPSQTSFERNLKISGWFFSKQQGLGSLRGWKNIGSWNL
jgi:hypothetical protein